MKSEMDEPKPVPYDEANFKFALLGLLLPPVTVVLAYFWERGGLPLRARSTLRGAAWGVVFWYVWSCTRPLINYSPEHGKRMACQDRLKQVAAAVRQYSQDYDEQLPDVSSTASIRAALGNYAPNTEVFACVEGELPFRGNPAVSLRTLDQIKQPATTILFFDGEPAHLGGRNVCYVDGHVKWMKEEKWQGMRKKFVLR